MNTALLLVVISSETIHRCVKLSTSLVAMEIPMLELGKRRTHASARRHKNAREGFLTPSTVGPNEPQLGVSCGVLCSAQWEHALSRAPGEGGASAQ